MTRCPNCHEILAGYCNFCICGFLYDPRELNRDTFKPGKYIIYRSDHITRVDDDFKLTEPPPDEPEPKKVMPGWWWGKLKKQKKKREEGQEKIEYTTQLNLLDNTTAGAR